MSVKWFLRLEVRDLGSAPVGLLARAPDVLEPRPLALARQPHDDDAGHQQHHASEDAHPQAERPVASHLSAVAAHDGPQGLVGAL